MTTIFLNIYFVESQTFVRLDFNDKLTSLQLQEELTLHQEDAFRVVGGGRIPMTDESKAKDVWRSLWDFPAKSFRPPKRNQTLRDMFPDHVENELHLLVIGRCVPHIIVYSTHHRAQYCKETTPLLHSLHYLLADHFSQEEMRAIRFIRPARPIFDDGIIDIDTTVMSAVDASGEATPNSFPWTAAPVDVLPWGGFAQHISLIAHLPGLEHDNILTQLPTVQRQRYFEHFRTAQGDSSRPIYCGRPAEDPVPASLLDENLSQFRYDLKMCIPSPADITLFRKLRATLTAIFEKEGDRQEAFTQILAKLIPFGSSLRKGGIGAFVTDGDIRVSFHGITFMFFLQEIKNESVGALAEPYFQGIHYWLAYVDSCLKRLNDDQKQRINFPTLLLSHFGPFVTIAAATFGGSPNVEPLVTLSLHVHPTHTEALAEGERMVCALRKCLHKLYHYYLNFDTSNSCQAGFPFRNYFMESDGIKKYFVYDKRIPEKRLFYAHSEQTPPTRYCIKFSRRYSEAAHRAAAELGFAPRLYAVEEFHGWYMIVMEDLSANYVTLDTVPGHGMSIHVKDTITMLHNAGFVHGDVRDLNILVWKSSAPTTMRKLQLIDFDWAGRIGEASYPHGMNPAVPRAPDATVGGLITTDHDMYMVALI